MAKRLRLRIMAIVLASTCCRAMPSAGDETPSTATIRLTNGDFAVGRLVDSSGPNVLAWQSPAFATPFPFRLDGIASVAFPVPEQLPQPAGDYCFELADGSALCGSLTSIDATEVVIDAAAAGTLHIDRSALRSISRRKPGDDPVYFGPGGLTGWQTSGNADSWREKTGALASDRGEASIRRDFVLPEQVCIAIELAWNKRPDFVFSLESDRGTVKKPVRLEVWGDDDLVVVSETQREADVESLKTIPRTPDGISLQLYLDQATGHLLVYGENGKPLAKLSASSGMPMSLRGMQLTNKTGDIRLERLKISRWSGEPPLADNDAKPRIHVSDGSVVDGQISSFDANRREFRIDDGDSERTFSEEQILDVTLPAKVSPAARTLQATLLTGMQISGELARVERETLWMKCPGIREPVPLPVADLRTLIVRAPAGDKEVLSGREGRLELDGTVLQGCLVDGGDGAGEGLFWQPHGCDSACALLPSASARILYRDTEISVGQPAAPTVRLRSTRTILDSSGRSKPAAQSPPRNVASILHLRSGDRIPCTVIGADEHGVTIRSAVTESTFIKHDQIKVVELDANAPAVTIPRTKTERLLILPRMQRDNPPTQLIRSVTGDYLRGRLLSMDDKELQVELSLEQKPIPRGAVARIIWLHPDELAPAEKPAAVDTSPRKTRIQAVQQGGNRLTFFAGRLDGTTLSGHSDILGACQVDLRKIDQILVGETIEQAAATLAFHQWRLRHATDPLDAGESGEGDDGLASALVGQAAPGIELDQPDGQKFRLSDCRNQVVVLDFWASWCGPCLQTMPQVDSVVREFADRDVLLVAVNLEETAETVKGALERLKLETTVALDRNGRVAERYGVTLLPQTVIIDRDGKVARLFVGGGARFGDQLRTALQAVLAESPTNSK